MFAMLGGGRRCWGCGRRGWGAEKPASRHGWTRRGNLQHVVQISTRHWLGSCAILLLKKIVPRFTPICPRPSFRRGRLMSAGASSSSWPASGAPEADANAASVAPSDARTPRALGKRKERPSSTLAGEASGRLSGDSLDTVKHHWLQEHDAMRHRAFQSPCGSWRYSLGSDGLHVGS